MSTSIKMLFFIIALTSFAYSQWEWQYYSPTGNDLKDVSSLPSGISVAVGERGIILRTSDHGANWAIVDSGNGNTLNGVKFIDETHCIAVGMNGVIVRSTDAGLTWSHGPEGAIRPDYSDILIQDNLWLLASNLGIHRSTDGGNTWALVPLDSGLNASRLVVQSRNHFWALGQLTLLESTDGGLQWANPASRPGVRTYTALVFTDSLTGWLGGYYGILNDYDAYLYKTTDGGTSWKNAGVDPYAFGLPDIGFADPMHGWYLTRAHINYTGDGGATWTTQEIDSAIAKVVNPQRISIIDQSTAIVAGKGGQALRTVDGGAHWLPMNPGSLARFNNVQFLNDAAGYLGGDLGVFRTTDGGKHYRRLPFDHEVEGMFFTDTLNGWVSVSLSGGYGSIHHTTDGGETWQDQTGSIQEVYALWFTDPVHGYAAANSSTLYRTSDGGGHWTPMTMGSAWLTAVKFANHRVGWLAGSSIFKTTDGGSTWSQQSVQNVGDFALGALSVIDEKHAWAVGQNSLVIATTNGGADWIPQTHFPAQAFGGYYLIDTWFLNPDTGWVTSSDVVYTTTDAGNSWSIDSALPAARTINKMFVLNGRNAWFAGNNAVFHNGAIGPLQPAHNEVTVAADRAVYHPFEIIHVAITYWNNTDTTTLLYFPSTCQYNFCVDTGWCWGDNRACGDMITTVSIPPHATYTWTDSVVARFGAGEHLLTGWAGDPWYERFRYGTGYAQFRIDTTVSCFSFPVYAGWNMLSYPLQDSVLKSAVFPNAISHAYRFAGVYHYLDELQHGKGFWLKFAAPEIITVCGRLLTADTIDVVPGWNFVGALSVPVAAVNILGDPYDMIIGSSFFGYKQGYASIDTLRPGQGYWVKATGSGRLILSGAPPESARAVRIIADNELPPPPPDEFGATGAPSQQPQQFALEQNYPNPFNPATRIHYALPEESDVRLTVVNVYGQEVASLIRGRQQAGYREAVWNAEGVASGIYFYRLEAAGVSAPSKHVVVVKKMALVR